MLGICMACRTEPARIELTEKPGNTPLHLCKKCYKRAYEI